MNHPPRFWFWLFILCCLVSTSVAQVNTALQSEADTFPMSVQLDDIVVTAQPAPTSSENALQSIRVIKRERIEQLGANNLAQLLQQDINIRIQQDPIIGSGLSLLGVGGENVKILIDGVPVIGRLNGSIDLSQINLNNVERIEIVEGPMSVSYGTDAIGGVINLITKKSQLHQYEASITTQLETLAESSVLLDGGIRWKDNWLLRVNAGRDWFDGAYVDSLRSTLWNPKQQLYTDLSLRHDFGNDHRIQYQFSFFDEAVQNLGNVRRPQFKPYAFDDHYLTRRTNHAIHHEGSLGDKFYWQNALGYNYFERELRVYRSDFDEETHSHIDGDTTTFDNYMWRSVLASQLPDQKLNFQIGIDLRRETAAGARIVDADGDAQTGGSINELAAFGSLRYRPIPELNIEAGLRALHHSRYEAPLIPSFHLKYQFSPPLSLRFSYGRGFRSPSLKELFLSFVDINHFLVGNPDLQAETSDNLQLNVQYRSDHERFPIQLRAQLFYNRISDQIQLFPFLERDGQLIPTTPDQSIQYAYFNIRETKIQGINLRASYGFSNWEVEGGLSTIGFYNALSEAFEEVEPFTYIQEWSGRVSYQLPFWKTNVNAFWRYNDQFVSYFPEIHNGTQTARQSVQDGFHWMDASISQPLLNNRIQLTAGIRNVLNVQQINLVGNNGNIHTSGGNIPVGAGRSFFVRAQIQLVNNQRARFKNAAFQVQQKEAFRLHQLRENVYATWVEQREEGEQTLQYAQWQEEEWSLPKTIAVGKGDWAVNEVDAPQLVAISEEGEMLASWLHRTSQRNVYDHDIEWSRSNKNNKKWRSADKLADSAVPAYYGLPKFLTVSNDSLLAVWIDGRTTKQPNEEGTRYYPNPNGKLQLYTATFNEKGKRQREHVITTDVSPMCPFELLQTNKTPLLVYRNQAQNIVVQRLKNGNWSSAAILHDDRWDVSNTIEAPAADAINNKVAIAWYSERQADSKWQLAMSEDGGDTFQLVLSKKIPNLVGKIQLRWWNEETICVTWLERNDTRTALILNYLDRFGNLLHQEKVIDFPVQNVSTLPMLTIANDQLLMAWKVHPKEKVHWWTRQPSEVLLEAE
jgi:outer membrane receptor for ferrienterochelin and colicins